MVDVDLDHAVDRFYNESHYASYGPSGPGTGLGTATGKAIRPYRQKMAEKICALDFAGIVGNGTTDCIDGIKTAMKQVFNNSVAGRRIGGVLWFPAAHYAFSATIPLYSQTGIVGDGTGMTRFIRLSGYPDGFAMSNKHADNPNYLTDILITLDGFLIDGNAAALPGNDKDWNADEFTSMFRTVGGTFPTQNRGLMATNNGGIQIWTTKVGSTISSKQDDKDAEGVYPVSGTDLALTDSRHRISNVMIWDVGGDGIYVRGNCGGVIHGNWVQRARRSGCWMDLNDSKLSCNDFAACDWWGMNVNGANNEIFECKGWFTGRDVRMFKAAQDYLNNMPTTWDDDNDAGTANVAYSDPDGYGKADADRYFNNRFFGAGLIDRGDHNRWVGNNVQDTGGHGHVIHGLNCKIECASGDQIGQINGFDTWGGAGNFLALSGNTAIHGMYVSQNTHGSVEYQGGDRTINDAGTTGTKRVKTHLYTNATNCEIKVCGNVNLTIDGARVTRGSAATTAGIGWFEQGNFVPPTVNPGAGKGMLWNNGGTPAIS